MSASTDRRRRATKMRSASPLWASAVFDALDSSACVLDREGRIVAVNAAWGRFTTGKCTESATVGADYLEVCERAAAAGDEDAGAIAAALRSVLAGAARGEVVEYPCECAGCVRWFVARLSGFGSGARRRVLVLHEDVSELKLTQAAVAYAGNEVERVTARLAEAFRLGERHQAIMSKVTDDGVFDWAPADSSSYCSQRLLDILGLPQPGEADGASGAWWLARAHPDDADRLAAVLREPLAAGGPFATEVRMLRADGRYVWCAVRGYAVPGRDGGPVERVVGTLTDVSFRKRAEAALLAGASRDGLTGLPNRLVFLDRLGQALVRLAAARDRGTPDGFALLLVDLDRFGAVNRQFGGDVGDAVLTEVAARLAAQVPGGSVARIGSDEFGMLVDALADEPTAVAERVVAAVAEPIQVGTFKVNLTASVGLLLADTVDPDDNVSAVMANADMAMLAARGRGGGAWQVFEPRLRAKARRSFEIADGMREALAAPGAPRGFHLAYQPVVDLAEGRTVGFEALMRWNHPTLGPVPPDDFIPVAEAQGFIVPLGAWALREACGLLARWRAEYGDRTPFVSVNVSAHQLYEPGFDELVRSVLAETGAPADCLKVEVTESAILDNALRAASVLSSIQRSGVRIAIDDFGSGFSCLGYLSRFRFDDLKIDASFVRGMTGNERAMAVVKTIVELGQGLRMSVIAEGAEHEGEVLALNRVGCPLVQGYYFGRPVPLDQAERIMREGVGTPWPPAA